MEANGQDERRSHQRCPESPGDQRAHRHGGHHAGKAEGARDETQLPVGERLGPADLGQQRTEGAYAEGVAEEENEEETVAVEREGTERARHLNERSVHHG